MKRFLLLSFCLTLLSLSCTKNDVNGHWIVDHYYSKKDDPIPVQPLRISAGYFDSDQILRKFILQDVTWKGREIGQLFYLNDRLSRVVIEDEHQVLLFEILIEYDQHGEIFELKDPLERFAHGSSIVSEPLVQELASIGLKKPAPKKTMEVFRSRVNADKYNHKTDRIPQHNLTESVLDSLRLAFGGRSAMDLYDFRINTRDFKINYYERIFKVQIEIPSSGNVDKINKDQVRNQLSKFIADHQVLSSFNTYEVVLDDNKLVDAGGFGLINQLDQKITLSAKEMFGAQ